MTVMVWVVALFTVPVTVVADGPEDQLTRSGDTSTTKLTSVADFTAGGFGSLIGLGAEFCVTPSSCFNFEGNYRYLVFDRNIVTGSAGAFANSGSLSQYGKGQELEMNNSDVATRMSGLMFLAGYTYWF